MGTSTPFPMSGEVTDEIMVQLYSLLSQTSLDNLVWALWYHAEASKLPCRVDEQGNSSREALSVSAKVFINV